MSAANKRLAIALAFMTSFGLAFALPDVASIRPSAVIMSLPGSVDDWSGRRIEESRKVVETLAKDTNYEKAQYMRPSATIPGKTELIIANIVLAGQDPNNSIHRPERCIPAQGNRLLGSSEVTLPVFGIDPLKVTRLHSRGIEDGVDWLTYYWFIGNSQVTNGHYERTFLDMRDRLLGGFNQRWAYVTVAAPFGYQRENIENGSKEEVSKMIEQFIIDLFPKIHRVEMLPIPEEEIN